MRCAIYRRVSTDMQVEDGVSLDNQLARLYAFAESQGWTVVEQFIDEGISAKSIDIRPGIQSMLAAIKDKRFDVLLVYKLDRLVRNVKDLHVLLQLMDQYDVKFRSCTEAFDTTTANGRLFITIIATLAQWERETTAERVYDNMKHRAEQGKRNGGPPPFGYDYNEDGDLFPNPEESKWIRFIFSKYKTHGSQNIAKMLNQYGIKTKKQALWSDFGVRFVLKNPIYAGKNRWNMRSPVKGKAYTGEEIVKDIDQDDFEPIISLDEFNEIQKIIQTRSQDAFRSDNHYPFSGIAKCAKCGNPMTGAFKKRKAGGVYRFYKCSGRFKFGVCSIPTLAEESIDTAFIELLELAQADLEIQEMKDQGHIDPEHIQKQLQRVADKKERLKELYIDGDISKDKYKKKLDQYEVEAAELNSLLEITDEEASIEEVKTVLENIKQNWNLMSFESKKLAIQSLFESLTIEVIQEAKPGKYPEPAIVTIKDYLMR